MDYGHAQTDKMLQMLLNKINTNYKSAQKYVKKKAKESLKKFEKADKEQIKLLKKGLITQSEYIEWRSKTMMSSSALLNLSDTLSLDLSNANQIATSLINGQMPDVFALNANYGTYEIDSLLGLEASESFALYDHDTVVRLMRKNPEVVPKASVNIPKDKVWNRRKIYSALSQGILAGDSIPHIADRLQKVTDMNRRSAIRNARTYTTAAENGGRVDSYMRAKEMGIKIEQEWMATLDERTRQSHRMLDGEKIKIGGKFSNGCRYPGDPEGRPEEIYNCRCTLVAADPEFAKEDAEMLAERFSRLPEGMTYEEWKSMKTPLRKETHSANKYDSGYSTKNITKPVRPRKHEYDSYEEFEVARNAYRAKRKEYEEKMSEITQNAMSVNRFKSKDDFLEWANKNNIKIENGVLDKIDLRAFNESSYVLDEMFERFPEIKRYNFEFFDGSMRTSSFRIGLTDDGLLSANGGFNFNPSYFSDYEYGLMEAFEQQTDGTLIRGDGAFASLVRHEYGHNVQSYIETRISDKYHMTCDEWKINFEKFEDYTKAREQYWEERKQYEKELRSLAGLNGSSEYSNTNTAELFAEGFAEYTSGGTSEFGRAFGEFLRRWY